MYGKRGSFGYCWNHAVTTGGVRERYAIKQYLDGNGKRTTKHDGEHELWIFKYSADDPYQDANGATYDVTEGRWVG